MGGRFCQESADFEIDSEQALFESGLGMSLNIGTIRSVDESTLTLR
jgi:hypothetical protein